MSTEEYNRIEGAKRVLRDNGYVVIPEDRRVVITTQAILRPDLHPWHDEYLKCCWGTMTRDMAEEIASKAVCLKRDEMIHDPITGSERVLRMSLGIIKPREPEDHR